MTIIFGSFIAFALMGYKIYLTNGITEKFRETKGNGYMKLQVVSLFDELYTSTMSIVLFVTYIKLIKLLRFNNRFRYLKIFFHFVEKSKLIDKHNIINNYYLCLHFSANLF